MLTAHRGAAWAAALTALVGVAGCAADDGSEALAHVGGVPIEVSDVALLLPVEALVVTEETTQEVRADTALDLAVRDALLAREAVRRGLEGAGTAELLQALVAQERATHPELQPEVPTDSEVHAWYVQNRFMFDRVARASATYVVLPDERRAQQAFEQVVETEAGTVPAALTRVPDAEDHGTAVVGDGGEAPEVVERIVNAVRRAGGVGVDVDPSTGRYWLVHVDSIELDDPVWDEVLATRARTALVWEREQEHLRCLADDLSATTEVVVDEQNLQGFVASLDWRG